MQLYSEIFELAPKSDCSVVEVTVSADTFISNRTIPRNTLPTAAADGESPLFASSYVSAHVELCNVTA